MLWGTYTTGIPVLRAKKSENTTLKRVLHGGGGPQVGEVTRLGGVTRLSNNCQHCWMLHFASVSTPCCTYWCVVGSCRAKFENGQTFNYITQTDASSANIIGPTMLGVVGSVRSVISLLGVLASVCRQLPTRTQQVPTLSGQQCW